MNIRFSKKNRVSNFCEIDLGRIEFVSFFNVDGSYYFTLKGPLSQYNNCLFVGAYQYAFVNMLDGDFFIVKKV